MININTYLECVIYVALYNDSQPRFAFEWLICKMKTIFAAEYST